MTDPSNLDTIAAGLYAVFCDCSQDRFAQTFPATQERYRRGVRYVLEHAPVRIPPEALAARDEAVATIHGLRVRLSEVAEERDDLRAALDSGSDGKDDAEEEQRHLVAPEVENTGQPRWRTGTRNPRTLYRDGACVGIVDTPEIAAELVTAVSGIAMGRLRAEYDRGRQAGRHDVGKYANAIGRIDCALGRVGAKPLDETVRAVEELAAKLRLVASVAARGPRFTDRHMEAAAEQVLDELRAALRGEGL